MGTNERMSQFQVPLVRESGGRDALPMQIMQLHGACIRIARATDVQIKNIQNS